MKLNKLKMCFKFCTMEKSGLIKSHRWFGEVGQFLYMFEMDWLNIYEWLIMLLVFSPYNVNFQIAIKIILAIKCHKSFQLEFLRWSCWFEHIHRIIPSRMCWRAVEMACHNFTKLQARKKAFCLVYHPVCLFYLSTKKMKFISFQFLLFVTQSTLT